MFKQSRAFPRRIEQHEQARKVPREIERKLLLRKNTCEVFLNMDHERIILFITPTLPGYTFEDTSGITFYGFIDSKIHTKTRKVNKEVLKSGEVVGFETNSFGADGSLIIYSIYPSPFENSNKVIRMEQVLTNITTCNKTEK